jgi:hypothetical protein
MKKLFTLIAFAAVLGLTAQNIPPQAINFQGVAIDKNGIPVPGMDELGNPIQNSAIRVRFSILTGSATGTASYQEEHLTTTDEFGRFNLEIGRGTATNGTFTGINWGGDKHFLQVEVDLSALGTNYTLASIQEFLSVPYALYAKTAGSTGDGDTDPTNELQELSLSGNLLTISGGNSVSLPSSSDNQTLSIVGTTLTISNGNSVVIPDAQTLSLSGTSLSISNGNTVSIPANTDNQTLTLSGNSLSISNGNSVTLPTSQDNDTTNEIQHLVLNGSQLGLTKSGVTVNLGNIGQGSNLSQNSFCLSGGQYYDLSSLFNSYSNVGVEAILSSKILISCYDPTLGSARFWLNRSNGALSPFTLPSSVGWMRNSDSLLYMFGPSIYVYNANTNQYLDTLAISNSLGHATVDFKSNKLVFVAGSSLANSNLYVYNPITETQSSIPTPAGMINPSGVGRLFFIGQDSLYVGATLYSTQSLTPLLVNALPLMNSYLYDYNKRQFTYKVSTYYPFNQNPPRHQLKMCNRFGGAIQNASDEYIQTIGGPSVPGTGAGFELKSTINGDVIMYWDGGAFVFNNYWFTESTQTWLRMKNDGFVEQITPGNISVWGGFDFYQHPKNTVVKLLFNKNCVDNQMVNKGIYLFNR